MTSEQQTLWEVQEAVKKAPPEVQETVAEIAEHFRQVIKKAPQGEGAMALALVGAEMAAQ